MSVDVCPYCRAPIDTGDEAVLCPGCSTPHHADCFAENGGCTVFGCTSAPPAEPKLSIGAADFNASPATSAQAAAVTATAPLPPPRVVPAAAPMSAPLFSSAGYNSAPVNRPVVVQSRFTATEFIEPGPDARNRTTFLLLGVLFGGLGVHSFYAGYIKKGLIQLAITLLTLGFGGIMVWIWAVIDICTITKDGDGKPFRN